MTNKKMIRKQIIQEHIIDKIPSVITVNVKQHNEDGDIYYLATSQDVPGFLCEGNTLDEIKNLTPHIIFSLYESEAERLNKAIDLAEKIANTSLSFNFANSFSSFSLV